MRFSLLLYSITALALILSSCTFDQLTDIHTEDTTAPSAEKCGSCHVEQYAEWKETAHAKAYISEEFKSQSDNYQDEECLFCHIPGEVLSVERKARNYNRHEGVTCVSCHLYEQTMHGPHSSGALFSPHSIAKNSKVDSRLESSQICGVCHEETYEQWDEQRKTREYPTCHGCHGVTVKRPHTKGTNFFSKMLVWFEPEHTVRSHYLILPNQEEIGLGPELSLDRIEGEMLQFSLLNSLPHDLPTGSFAEKELFFQFKKKDDDASLDKIVMNKLLAPGERHTFTLLLPQKEQNETLQVDLFREDLFTGKNHLIRSYTFSLNSTRQ